MAAPPVSIIYRLQTVLLIAVIIIQWIILNSFISKQASGKPYQCSIDVKSALQNSTRSIAPHSSVHDDNSQSQFLFSRIAAFIICGAAPKIYSISAFLAFSPHPLYCQFRCAESLLCTLSK
jgi:hypothetical protein